MKKLITILIFGVLLGCKPYVIETEIPEPEITVIHKILISYFDGNLEDIDWQNPPRKDCIFTREIPMGTELAVCWLTVSCAKGTKITANWFYEGQSMARVKISLRQHLQATEMWFTLKHHPIPSGDYEVKVQVGDKQDSITFAVQ